MVTRMIEIQKLSKSFGSKTLFQDFNLSIERGEYVVFSGASGCGKTTLMKVLMGVEDSHGGTISVRKGTKLGYLDQIYKAGEMVTVIQMLQESFENIGNLKNELNKLEEKLTNS